MVCLYKCLYILTVHPSVSLLLLQLDPPKTKGHFTHKNIYLCCMTKQTMKGREIHSKIRIAQRASVPSLENTSKLMLSSAGPNVRLLLYCRLESLTKEEMGFSDR